MLSTVLLALLAAQSPLPDDAAFNEGMRLSEEFEYEKAIFRFREALRDDDKTPKQKAICHIYIGLTLAELREDAAAGDAFDDAIRADPLVTLPPNASPKVKELLEAARRRMAAEAAAAPVSTPTPTPTPTPDPAPAQTGAMESPSTTESDGTIFLISGGVVAGLGAVTLLSAAVPGFLALDLNRQAGEARFGDETARLNGESVTMQIIAGALAGVGVVVLIGGGAMLAAGLIE